MPYMPGASQQVRRVADVMCGLQVRRRGERWRRRSTTRRCLCGLGREEDDGRCFVAHIEAGIGEKFGRDEGENAFGGANEMRGAFLVCRDDPYNLFVEVVPSRVGGAEGEQFDKAVGLLAVGPIEDAGADGRPVFEKLVVVEEDRLLRACDGVGNILAGVDVVYYGKGFGGVGEEDVLGDGHVVYGRVGIGNVGREPWLRGPLGNLFGQWGTFLLLDCQIFAEMSLGLCVVGSPDEGFGCAETDAHEELFRGGA